MTWDQMLAHWSAIEDDLHEVYGIDVETPGLLRARSWRWFRSRITGLLSRPPLIAPDGRAIASTRLGLALFPPTPPKEGT